eukprot:snap_masked-scaffold_25-processed-gene-0.28-mRNA-1 protein AED:1.00 eAED:1.00 QI:0/-1/0/0/-1/1/1/0/89
MLRVIEERTTWEGQKNNIIFFKWINYQGIRNKTTGFAGDNMDDLKMNAFAKSKKQNYGKFEKRFISKEQESKPLIFHVAQELRLLHQKR